MIEHRHGHLLDLGCKGRLHAGSEALARAVVLKLRLGVLDALLHSVPRLGSAALNVRQCGTLIRVVLLAHHFVRFRHVGLSRAHVKLEQRVPHADLGEVRTAEVLADELGDASDRIVLLVMPLRTLCQLNIQRPRAQKHPPHATKSLDRLGSRDKSACVLQLFQKRRHLHLNPRANSVVHIPGQAHDLACIDAAESFLKGVHLAQSNLEALAIALREGTLGRFAERSKLGHNRILCLSPSALHALLQVHRHRRRRR